MAGGTLEHGALCATVLRILGEQLRERHCRAYDSKARVRAAATGNAHYPAASVVCGSLELDPTDPLSMLTSSVLVEVLSPSTAEHDTTEKLRDYSRIAGLSHVVHVHHDARRVDVHTRQGDGFAVATFGPGEVARLPLADETLSVDDLYFDPLAVAR